MAKVSNVTIATMQQMLGLQATDNPRMRDAIFVCIDCEAYEHNQNKITEVGVAVLDTRDLAGLYLDRLRPEEWMQKMKYAHYRPVENSRFVNRKFVKGCEIHFNFGETTWVRLSDCPIILARIFRDPTRLDSASNFAVEITDQKRNVVFVAHDSRGDEEYLHKLGFALPSNQVIQKIDTGVAAGGTNKQTPGLLRLAFSLGLDPENLHNGGNDAAYTLQSFVVMALKEHENTGSVAADLALLQGKPVAKRVLKNARQVLGGTARFMPSAPVENRFASKSKPKPKPKSENTSSRNNARREHKETTRAVRQEKPQATS